MPCTASPDSSPYSIPAAPGLPRSVDNQFIRLTRHSPDIQSGFAAAQLLQGRNNPIHHMKPKAANDYPDDFEDAKYEEFLAPVASLF